MLDVDEDEFIESVPFGAEQAALADPDIVE
jgi:hypothetical protein